MTRRSRSALVGLIVCLAVVPGGAAGARPGSTEGEAVFESLLVPGPGPLLADLAPELAARRAGAAAPGTGNADRYLGVSLLDVGIPPEGDMPQDLAITPDHSTVLVCYSYSDTVTFLDVASGVMTGAVATGEYPAGIAVTSDGALAVTANVFSNDLTVIDVAGQTVAGTIALDGFATVCDQAVVVETLPGTHQAVVGCDVSDSLHVVDLDLGIETGALAGVPIWIRTYSWSSDTGKGFVRWNQMQAMPDGSRVLIPDYDAGAVRFFDPATVAIVDSLPVDARPAGIDIAPDGTLAVLQHATGDRITVFDPQVPVVTSAFTAAFSIAGDHILVTGDKQYILSDGPLNSCTIVRVADGGTAGTISSGSVGGFACTPDSAYGFVGNFNSRIFSLSTFAVVNTLTAGSVSATDYLRAYPMAAALNSTFSEEVYVYDIGGAAGSILASLRAGIPPEGDGPRAVSISPDGQIAAVANILSDSVSVVDLASGAVLGIASVGNRTGNVAVTPDGNYALALNFDESFVSIVDLATQASVANVPVRTRPTRVVFTPDGQRALVSSINNGSTIDYVSVLQLAGASTYKVADIVTGNQGTVPVSYFTTAGCDVSPDGAYAVQCNSADNDVDVIDLSSLSVVSSLATGNLPAEVAFSPTQASRALVSNYNSDTVSVLVVAGAISYIQATIPVGDGPYVIRFTPDGACAFVANYSGSSISVLRMSDLSVIRTIDLADSPRAMQMDGAGDDLYAACIDGTFTRIEVDGEWSQVVESTTIYQPVCDLAVSDALAKAVVPHVASDLVSIIDLTEPSPTPTAVPGTPTPVPPIPATGPAGGALLALAAGALLAAAARRRRRRGRGGRGPGRP